MGNVKQTNITTLVDTGQPGQSHFPNVCFCAPCHGWEIMTSIQHMHIEHTWKNDFVFPRRQKDGQGKFVLIPHIHSLLIKIIESKQWTMKEFNLARAWEYFHYCTLRNHH